MSENITVDVTTGASVAAVQAETARAENIEATLIPLAQKGAANGVATLDGSGKLTTAQLPSLSITDTFVVASQAAMLALAAQRGDVAIRTDYTPQIAFILTADDPTSVANWQELNPATTVTSVNGSSGAVTITAAGLGALAAANNLSDLVSAATARANLGLGSAAVLDVPSSGNAATGQVVKGSDTRLSDARTPVAHAHAESDVTGLAVDLGAKANDSAVVHNSGNETIAGTKTFSSAPVVPDGAFAEAKVANLVADLAARANPRGAWAATTAYAVNDLVTYNGGLYRANTAHTSTSSFDATKFDQWVPQSGTYAPIGVARRQYIPVADRATPSVFTSTLATADNQGTARLRHTCLATCHGLLIGVANWYNNAGTETDGPNDITVAVAVEPAATKIVQGSAYWSGATQLVIKPGKVGWFEIPVTLYKGQQFYTRVYVDPGSGQFPQGGITCVGTSAEGHNYAAAGADLTPAGSATPSTQGGTRVLGPSIILGLPATAGASVVGICGDSIAAGTGDSGAGIDMGFIERALNLTYPYINVAMPSQLVDGWYQQEGLTKSRQQGILDKANLTHIICELGFNGISAGLAAWQSHMIGNGSKGSWSALSTYGVPVYQTTLTPASPTTTDGWATTANQTPGANEANRVLINAWLRDGAPITAAPAAGGVAAAVGATGVLRAGQTGHPLAGILEVADLVESARDSGKYKAGVSYAITAASTASNVVTVTTATAHGLAVGNAVSIVGCDPAINSTTATYTVTAVGSATTFSFAKTTANATYPSQGSAVVPYTSDGTHPSQIGHPAASAAIVPASLGLVAST